MRYIKDIILLLLYCFLTLFYATPDLLYVLSFLATLILCCADYFLDLKKYIVPVFLIYFCVSLFFTPFLYFFPASTYLLFRHRCQLLQVAGFCILIWTFGIKEFTPQLLCISLLGLVISFLLQSSAASYETLNSLFKQTRDDSTELTLLLREKNHTLRDKQDYEIYAATLRERNRIAREIHDNVGHLLSRSILMVGALRTINQDDTIEEPLETLESTLSSAMDTIRSSVHDLHDEAINLEDTISSLIQEFTFCPVSFQYDMGREIPREIKYSFISITKEALSNILRHSNASHVSIIIREHPALFQLCIEDNGTQYEENNAGIGLINMKERVQILNGSLKIIRDHGFKLFITIPKEI